MLTLILGLVILIILAIFILNIRLGLLMFYLTGVSFQYLYKVDIGPLTALDVVGMGIPVLFLSGLVIGDMKTKDLFSTLARNKIVVYFSYLIAIMLFTGVLFPEVLYPSHIGPEPLPRIADWFKLFNMVVVLFVVSSVFTSEKQIDLLVNCMLVSLIVPGAYFTWENLTGHATWTSEGAYAQAAAGFHHPGVIAEALMFQYPLSLFKYFRAQNPRHRLFWMSVSIIILVLIYLTYRRGIWLGLFAQGICYLYVYYGRIKHKVLYASLIAGLLVVFPFTPLFSTLMDRFADFGTFFSNIPDVFSSHRYDNLFTGRWKGYRADIFYFTRHQPVINFLLGNGIGGTYYAAKLMGASGGGHNNYLILLIDFGMICFLLYGGFVLMLFRNLLQSLHSANSFLSQYSRMLLAILGSYLVLGCVTHSLYDNASNWLVWALVGAYIGLINRRRQEMLLRQEENGPGRRQRKAVM